ncbi:MAG: hypothetical protein LC808_00575, partial [Actinobacteria bacterium]|nr:hypothetical protein [Actinomycetota bacterium]
MEGALPAVISGHIACARAAEVLTHGLFLASSFLPPANAGEEGTPMLRVLTDDDARAELTCGLDEIVREGARRMLVAA